MNEQFTTKRDIIGAFADAMNLIDLEVQNHHEKVACLSFHLAETMGLSAEECTLAFAGGLLHDIGGILNQERISLLELEQQAEDVALAGASLLKRFSVTEAYAPVVRNCQNSWQHLKERRADLTGSGRIGHIIHLADVVSLLLDDSDSALNQISKVKYAIHCGEGTEFGPEVLAAFDQLCTQESIWLDVMYRPECFLDLISDSWWISMEELEELTEFMSKLIDFRSPFTAMHSAGVAATAEELARLVGMSDDECRMMKIAGYLHDVGKLKTPNEILEKPGKLTDEEFNVMKEHAYYSWILLKDVTGFEQIAPWAAFHHEKLSGAGYPFHLPSNELSLGSRIMTVADIFSAITEDRPYRKGMEKEKVKEVLSGDAKRGLISESLVTLLLDNFNAINDKRDVESRAASQKYQKTLAGKAE